MLHLAAICQQLYISPVPTFSRYWLGECPLADSLAEATESRTYLEAWPDGSLCRLTQPTAATDCRAQCLCNNCNNSPVLYDSSANHFVRAAFILHQIALIYRTNPSQKRVFCYTVWTCETRLHVGSCGLYCVRLQMLPSVYNVRVKLSQDKLYCSTRINKVTT